MVEMHQAAAERRADKRTTKRLQLGSNAVRWLLSRGGENIQELRSDFNVSISVKGERTDAQSKVEVRGRREDVDAALLELKKLQAHYYPPAVERAAEPPADLAKLEEAEFPSLEAEALRSARRQAKQSLGFSRKVPA